MKILTKYILKEHLAPLMFALSALTSLLLLNYVAKQFGQLVGKGLPWGVIAEFMFLSVPLTVSLTMPMAVLVATLHAFSRMASENEITAFKASGLALPRLMAPVIVATGLITLGMVWFDGELMPTANYRLVTLTNDIARKKPTFALKEQVINEVSPGRLFLRTTRLFGTNQMRDVTIYDLSDPLQRTTIRADSGTLELSPNRQDLLLTLYHGSWIVLKPEDPTRLQRVFFNVDFVKVPNVGNTLQHDSIPGQKGDREMTVCELERRVERLVLARDSVFDRVKALDASAVKDLKQSGLHGGLGTLYCDHRFTPRPARALSAVAAARTPPPAPPPPPAAVPAPAPVAAPVAAPAESAVHKSTAAVPPRAPPPSDAGINAAVMAGRPAVQAAESARAEPPAGAAPQAPAASAPPARQPAPPSSASRLPPARTLTPLESRNAPPTATERAVEAAQLKLQMGMAQTTIDGDSVEIEKKFALAAACVIFSLIGAPVALRFPRGGVGLTIGVSLGIFGVYYVGLNAGETLARDNLISPFWAMWSSNVALLAAGLVLTARLGREGTTSRGSESSEQLLRLRERLTALWRKRL